MKKYIKPAVITVKIDNQEILAGSKEGMLDGETGTQGSKRHNYDVFDDWDEEE